MSTLESDNFIHNQVQNVLIIFKCNAFHAFVFSICGSSLEMKENLFNENPLPGSLSIHSFIYPFIHVFIKYLLSAGCYF